jgi:hypothetical protein
MPLQQALRSLAQTFPDIVLTGPLAQHQLEPLARAFDVLLRSVGAEHELVHACVARHAQITNETGNAKASLRLFDALGAAWPPATLAAARLLMHLNRPQEALDRIKHVHEERTSSIRALASIRADAQGALSILRDASAHDSASEDVLVNYASLTNHLAGNASAAASLWERCLERYPNSLGALHGSGKLQRILDLEARTSEQRARHGQALVDLAVGSRAEQLFVTSEGLFRSAIPILHQVKHVKPVYMLEYKRALHEHSVLLSAWDNREAEGRALAAQAQDIQAESGLPSFEYQLAGWTLAAEHDADAAAAG